MKKTQRYKNDLNDIDDRDLSDKLEVVYLHVFVYVLELSVIERTAVLMVYDKYEKILHNALYYVLIIIYEYVLLLVHCLRYFFEFLFLFLPLWLVFFF